MSDVNVSIGVSLRELQQGLNQAGGMVKDFKQEASKAREAAMFLSNAIGSIGGASKGASALVGNLLGGFAMGGPMGLAIGGVNALIQVFKDLRSEQAAAHEEAKKLLKTLEEQNQQGLKARDNIELQRKLIEAKTEKERAELQAAADLEVAQERLNAAKGEYAKLQANSPALFEVNRKVMLAEQALQNQKLLNQVRIRQAEETDVKKAKDLAEQLTKKQESEENKRAATSQAALDARARRYEAAQRKEVQEAITAGQQKVAMLKSAGEEELAALDLLAAKKRLLEAKAKSGGAEMPQDLADQGKQEEERYNKQVEASRKLYELKRQLIEQAKTFEELAAVDRQAEALAAEERLANLQAEVEHTNKLAAIQEKLVERSAQYAEKMKQAWVSRLQPIANGFQTIFDSILDGGKNMGQVLGNVMKSILSSLVGMLIQLGIEKLAASIASHAAEKPVKVAEVTNAAGVAGAEAAAAMAGIPIVGPALAAAAMAETSALVLSSMLPLAAASGGFDIGNFNPVTQLHAKEMVLPAYLAERVRNMTEMPTQPTNVQVVISAVDSKSVERLFNDNQGALIQSIRTAVRNGRV